MARKKSLIPGFSWKRAVGITSAKQRIARATGVPTTKAGRKRKMQSTLWTAVAVGVAAACGKQGKAPQSEAEAAARNETVAKHWRIRSFVIKMAIALCIGLLIVLKIKSLLF